MIKWVLVRCGPMQWLYHWHLGAWEGSSLKTTQCRLVGLGSIAHDGPRLSVNRRHMCRDVHQNPHRMIMMRDLVSVSVQPVRSDAMAIPLAFGSIGRRPVDDRVVQSRRTRRHGP